MGESSHQQTTSSRLGGKATVGEIVEVQGGHIVRSTGRKDRHSKVCTAKGPRDRRVRLAAHTAIQFYDVQDRLGYDRPSKAVDWLIKKAKAAIDELAQLPAWHPTACSGPNVSFEAHESQQKLDDDQQLHHQQSDLVNSSKRAVTMAVGEEEDEHHDLHQRGIGNNSNNTQISSFLPPSLDSDVIADTIKSFFPMGASGEATSSSMQFQSFQNSDMMQRSSSHSQDLRLSLQSFQDPIMLHESPNHQAHSQARHVLSGTPLGFDGGSWSEHHQFQRLPPWNAGGGDTASGSGGGAATSAGYYFNSPAAPQPLLQQLLVHNQLFSSQRGPLQSSNTPSLRAWIDPSAVDHGQHHHPGGYPVYPSSVSGAGYGGFTGFHIPARIQGDEEEHDGYSDKPSSASSDSRH